MRHSKRNNPPGAVAAICTALAVALAAITASSPRAGEMPTVEVSSVQELQKVLATHDRADTSGIRIVLRPGTYFVGPTEEVHSIREGCTGVYQVVPITVGLRVSGVRVVIEGTSSDDVVIHTGAGYGVYFDRCRDCAITNVTITGGERDTARVATDAAVVARDSYVTVRNCVIANNLGDPDLLRRITVGIGGVCGREDSFLHVANNEIVRNSWDGVLLDDGSRAVVERNLIDGVDGEELGFEGGRGVGIRVTCNAQALVEKNLVRRYWTGIGVFQDARATINVNFVENMRVWGIALWDGFRGRPNAVMSENLVYQCGACGVWIERKAPWEEGEDPAGMYRNFIVHTGQDSTFDADDAYCYQCPLSIRVVPDGFVRRDNTYYRNRRVSSHDDTVDRTREWFWRERRSYVRKYRNTPLGVDGRYSFWDGSFMRRYTRF